MLDIVKAALTGPCGYEPGGLIVVGFSGGADSLCLLHVLHRAGVPLAAAHFNHQLRAGAEDDSRFAAALAGSLQIPFTAGTGDVRGFAEKQGLSLETAARQLRYEFLFAEADRLGAKAVAVAHHADDQAETVLLHILRGAGGHGLQGMSPRLLPSPWSEAIPLIRPLLACWKEELLAYCAEHSLDFREDETNLDPAYRRNAIRHGILPALADYNPQIKQALWRLAQIARDEQEVIEGAAEAAVQTCITSRSAETVGIDAAAFRGQPAALQRLVLRRAFASLRPGAADLDFAAVERARTAVLQQGHAGQVDLVHGLRLEMLGPLVRLVTWEGAAEANWPQASALIPIEPGGLVDLGRGWVLDCQPAALTAALRQAVHDNSDPFQAWVDAEAIDGPLALKPRWAGARFQPFGMAAGSQKISDVMINHKIPRPARAGWPLVCAGPLIVWAPGMGTAHVCRVTTATVQVLHFTLRQAAEPGADH